ncbi:vam6/Vps39-like protein [Amyelois transitella]|uniref:vam6/Vps39-like protein n=1 Tax=Amyelois transitella TaxID=680683 RepID=UPI00298F4CB1|nr:vam6/Vps39-like protein [Amyelois transitella]XP_060804158.1 vam6/Vps39-like protein [Amyelois transitella]
MHEAYEVSPLLTVTVQIEAIAAYDGNLLLGTRQGHLLMYSLSNTNNGNQSQGKYTLQLLRYCKNFSKKPIQQIDVIPEKNLLLCLSDYVLATYDINGVNFPLVDTFQQTKGASLFALDNKSTTSITGESNSVVRLCVAVRRKLQLYTGTNGKFKQHLFDFTMPDVPKVLAWGQENICVGFKSEYTLYDLSSGKPKELFPAGSSKSLDPTIAKYSETAFLLGRDQTSVLVEEAKDIEIKKTIKWSEPPISVVWDEPFVVGLLQEQIVVQTIEPPLFIQSISELNKARLMYRCKRGLIFIASVGQVWCLSSVDVTKQRNQLLKDKQFQIAIDLTNLSECSKEEKETSIRSILSLYAHELFEMKDYSASMKEFLKLNTNPSEVIALFPDLDGKELKHKLKGEDLQNALKALIEYLLELRRRFGGSAKIDDASEAAAAAGGRDDGGANVQQQLELIDTTLLKCYLQTNDAFVASLLRLNNCRLEDAEKTLLQHGKYSELIILYQTKGQHTKALQLLREQAKQPDSSLKGYSRTKIYLQNLGAEHINLIFKFSDWILKEHPEEGLKIFTEDKVEVENLPRPKILDFLLREHESLVIPYLEHVIHTWNDTNSLFHDALVSMYREKITVKKANLTEEELQHAKSKLITFLEKSSHYTPERVILHFPNDSLFEERAIILGKLGRHEQTLAIYVQILGDVDRAIRYCENICQSSKDKNQDVYVILMKILVNPEHSALSGPLAKVARHPDTASPDLETALDILEKHGDNISVLKALSVLPDNVLLARLKTFLECALDGQLALKRRTQMLKGLLYAEHVQVQELKQFHESKSVVINDYNVCPVCKKRFGNQSAFVRYPNGDIVHYSCRLDK